MIPCPRCGHPNADDARYCSNCARRLGQGAPPTETRKTVTVMFMDAVGSTGIGERTDPETLRRVMARYFEEIRLIVERHGGVIEKYIGDAIMAVFGVPTVHEDDTLRAVRAADEIRARVGELDDELRRERGLAIRWRTGINTGEVVAGDAGAGQRFVSGDAVNVAARLEQAAAAGEILLGAETWRTLREAVSVEAAPSISAKGKSAPLEAYRLVLVQAGLGQPARHLESPMVGRQRPRRLLADAFDQVVSERVCHLFTVTGAAGVGKSRLIREFLADLGDRALVLRGSCLSYGEGITYWPIGQIVRQASGITDDDSDEQVADKIGRQIGDDRDKSKAVRRLGEIIGRFEGSAGQEETFWAVRMLLESMAQTKPLVVVLDDLHWAEPTLLDLVDQLVDWTRDAPLLLICVCRQELLEKRPGWGGGKSYATTLTLEPLGEDESRQLVSGLLGRVELGAAGEQRLLGAAEGNPLFVEELVAMLIDSGRLIANESGWSISGDMAQIDVPPTIHAVLAARLDGLPAPERTVLERASVEGKVFHRGAVAELITDPLRDTLSVQLRSLSRKELVRPARPDFAGDEAYRFRHMLIRDAAYATLPKETRADLHAKFAGWLSRMSAEHQAEYEEILGYHYQQAAGYRSELGLSDQETARLRRAAVEHLVAAGERALERSDMGAARKLLESASALTPDDEPMGRRLQADLADTLAKLGELRLADEMLVTLIDAARRSGDVLGQAYAEVVRIDLLGSLSAMSIQQIIADCERLLSTFEQHGDRRGAAKATYELARHQFFAGHAKVAEQILLTAIDRADTPAAAAQFSTWLPPALLWGPTPVVEAEARVAALLHSTQSRNVEAMAAAGVGMLRAFVGAFDEGRQHIQDAIAIREELGLHVAEMAHEGNFLALVEMLAQDYEAAERLLLRSFAGLTEAGERGFASTVAGHIANLYVILDRHAEAEHYSRLAREMAPFDDIDAQTRGLRSMARVLAARGDIGPALDLAGRAKAIVDTTDYLDLRGQTSADVAEVRLAAADVSGARASLAAALADFEAKGITVEAQRVARRLAQIA